MEYRRVADYYEGSTSKTIITEDGRAYRRVEPDMSNGSVRYRVKVDNVPGCNVTEQVLNTPIVDKLTELPGLQGLVIDEDRNLYKEVAYSINSHGYYVINITYTQGSKRVPLHQVVWTVFNRAIPKGHVVHHKDFTKTNNHKDNLQLVTRKEHNGIHGNQRKYKEVVLEKDGQLYRITDIRGFSKSQGHNSTHIYELIAGTRKSMHGFTLVSVEYI